MKRETLGEPPTSLPVPSPSTLVFGSLVQSLVEGPGPCGTWTVCSPSGTPEGPPLSLRGLNPWT